LEVILLSLFPCLNAWAQSPFSYHFDTESGLPSSEIYDIAFDDEGIGWFATDRGLAAYNGYEFEVYTTQNGLSNNTILYFKKDPWGKIWMVALDGSISYLDEGEIYSFAGNDSLGGIQKRNWLIHDLVWDEQGRMIFWHNASSKVDHYYRWDPRDQTLERYDYECLAVEYSPHHLNRVCYLDVGHGYVTEPGFRRFTMLPDGSSLYTNINHPTVLYRERDKGIQPLDSLRFPGLIHSFYPDPEGGTWVCTSKGLYYFEDLALSQATATYFEGTAISRISRDTEGNYWASSLSEGIHCIPSFAFQTPETSDSTSLSQTCISFAQAEGYLFVGTMAGQLLVVDSNLQVYTLYEDPNFFGKLNDPHVSLQQVHFPGITITPPSDEEGFQMTETNRLGRHIFALNDSTRCTIGHGKITWENTSTKVLEKILVSGSFSRRMISALQTDSCFWIGSITGLIRLHPQPDSFQIEMVDFGIPAIRSRINDLKGDAEGRLYVGTCGNGLVIVDHGQHLIIQEKDGLSSNMINRLWVEDKHTVWLATNQGLDRIVFAGSNRLELERIDRIHSIDGLPSPFVRDVTAWQGKIWAATNAGLVYFDPETVIQESAPIPKVRFQSIAFNHQSFSTLATPILASDENNLSIEFLAVCHNKSSAHPFYRYRLKGTDTTWNYTHNRRVQFPGLPSGNYLFEVSACNRFQEWDPEPARFQFSIRPHFSRTWWFQSLIILVIAILISSGVLFRSRQKRLKTEQRHLLQSAKLKTREAELAALRNQMNPHFVFNTLNAIQNFIFRKDTHKASYFLGSFAKLIRDGLEFSLQQFVPLSDELKFLDTYLELESLRFPNRFDYEICVEDGLNPDEIKLPPFLFQPILENAIKHGFKGIQYKGKLSIHISGSSDLDIQVTIRDNGSGISTTRIPKRSPYPSRGLQIVQNHISLINNNIRQASFTFSNRSDRPGTESIFIFSF